MSYFERLASATRQTRINKHLSQEEAALECAIGLRTLQKIESGDAVNVRSLFAYLDYLELLAPMMETLPDPDKLSPMELLKLNKKKRSRVSKHRSTNEPSKKTMTWDDD